MKTLLKDLKPHRKEVVLAPLFKMLEAVFELFVPLVMKSIMDVGIPSGDRGSVLRSALLLVLLAFVGLASAVTAQYFSAKAATGFAGTLRKKLFRRIQTMSFSALDEHGASTLITRMTSDVNQVQNGVNLTLRLFLRSPFIVFGALIMAFVVDPKRAWIFAVVIPLLLAIVFFILLIALPRYKKVQSSLDTVTRSTRENLSGVRVIRAFILEDSETEKFIERNRVLRSLQTGVGRISAFLNPVTYVIINLGLVAILYFSGLANSTEGTVIALVNYMSQILVELVKLANLLIQMTRAAASLSRISEVLSPAPDDENEVMLTDAPENGSSLETDTAVRFDHVSMAYRNAGENALTDVTFTAKKGETIGIIGGTGSGKSTLVSVLSGLYPIDEGNVEIDGIPIGDYDRRTLRNKIGFVMQHSVLFRGTVRDNLLMGDPDADDETLVKALRDAQAFDFVMEKEGGPDAEVTEGGVNFSGGQRQRLQIARALVRRPEILILDDASSALDFQTDAALRETIRNDKGLRTVFIISARTASVMHADRILVMEEGRVVSEGTHRELLDSSEVYREIYESQYGEIK
ncbi:MAG: ABC transporter ATP-binding protein [Lachnospiraceae bacterium]|nr:ABC transporter ATP-binding protein [Lachnospiraceae bacterium]